MANGVAGYHFFCQLAWIDSLYDPCMILTFMGLVNTLMCDSAKTFASFYALLNGFVVLIVMGVTIASLFHPTLHQFYFDEQAFDEN